MAEEPGLSDRHPRASPWPLFVALGLALSEVGIFLGLFPVAVAGVGLLGGSVAGILRESGYARRTWLVLTALGGGFVVLGVAVVATQVSGSFPLRAVLVDPNGVVGRGLAILVGGLLLLAAGAAGYAVGRSDH